jgi:hypothetical protein
LATDRDDDRRERFRKKAAAERSRRSYARRKKGGSALLIDAKARHLEMLERWIPSDVLNGLAEVARNDERRYSEMYRQAAADAVVRLLDRVTDNPLSVSPIRPWPK